MSTTTTLPASAAEPEERTAEAGWVMEQPEYLLLLVVAFILWTFGFIELLNNTSRNPDILGTYSASAFVALAVYTCGFVPLIVLMARPSRSGWLTGTLAFIQRRSWLAIPLLLLIGYMIWTLMTVEANSGHPLARLADFPFLRFTAAGLLFMAGLLILFAGWGKTGPVPWWRKGIALLLALLVVVELVVQLLALAGWLPGTQRIANLFVPYGRVYQNAEGYANDRVNNFGLYYPDFQMQSDGERILLLGDTFVQALQIEKSDHMGVALQALINGEQVPEGAAGATEVLALGMPGFGPGLYLSDSRLADTVAQFDPDEIILFFHLANDFQRTAEPTLEEVVYRLTPDGGVELHPDGEGYIHSLKHYILGGYSMTIDPLATLRTNLLSFRLLDGLAAQPVPAADPLDVPAYRVRVTDKYDVSSNFAIVRQTELLSDPGASNFLFEAPAGPEAEESMAVAAGLLTATNEFLQAHDVDFKIVTIPAFPAAFYTDYTGTAWSPVLASYDLFGPEKTLQAAAARAGIPLLPLGQAFQRDGLTVAQVQDLFFDNGAGHLTPTGHAYVADLLNRCFFTNESVAAEEGCPVE